MKPLLSTVTVLSLLMCLSCQKDTSQLPSKEETDKSPIRDSISFALDGITYSSNMISGWGVGNRQVNIKSYSDSIPDRSPAYITGGLWWYGEKDSVIFDQSYSFRHDNFSKIEITFGKKYHINELDKESPTVGIPLKKETILKEGKGTFATDYGLENTTDGFVMEIHPLSTGETFTTYIPAFSPLIRSSLTNDLQDNSTFEITKIERITDDIYLVEAKFEVNVYTEKEKQSRITDGFVRFTTRLHNFQ